TPLCGPNVAYPDLPDARTLDLLGDHSSIDLKKTICIVGYGEIGPFGSSYSRWELESHGSLSLEGALEMAWMMGYVKYQKADKGFAWVDAKTGDTVPEWEMKSRFEKEILAHSGIRIIDPEHAGFDPRKMSVYTDVVLEDDFCISASSEEEAHQFKTAFPEE